VRRALSVGGAALPDALDVRVARPHASACRLTWEGAPAGRVGTVPLSNGPAREVWLSASYPASASIVGHNAPLIGERAQRPGASQSKAMKAAVPRAPLLVGFQPREAASVAGNDAPFIGERAATRGRVVRKLVMSRPT
jgi:hypothetical protein